VPAESLWLISEDPLGGSVRTENRVPCHSVLHPGSRLSVLHKKVVARFGLMFSFDFCYNAASIGVSSGGFSAVTEEEPLFPAALTAVSNVIGVKVMKTLGWLLLFLGGFMFNATGGSAVETLRDFLAEYRHDYHKLFCDVSYSWWDAMTIGTDETFERYTQATIAMSAYHSSQERYETFRRLLAEAESAGELSPLLKRETDVVDNTFRQSQFPREVMERMAKLSGEIEQAFQNQRGLLDGKEYTNNELLEMLEKEIDSQKRQEIWEALKQVGEIVADRIVELAKIRNEAARLLGFNNYWEMSVSHQDFEPAGLIAIFDELEKETAPIFEQIKGELDEELKAKFGVTEIMPWHYDNPFFQQAPPSTEIDKNIFFKGKTAEDINQIAIRYYDALGLETRGILSRSDLFDREGKSQHAFSNNMNLDGDVRVLCNLKPTANWMCTHLHELGHSVYEIYVDPTLPCDLRTACHIFTTEGIAMMFEKVTDFPAWLTEFAGVDPETAARSEEALRKQRVREQLLFCRWTIVMFHFERALYEDPDQDLRTLWWDTVEKYQLMKRPPERHKADWASKPHFVIAPVYYHNYMLGELFGAQLRRSIPFDAEHFASKEIGARLIETIFKPGMRYHWNDFVKEATGEPLSPKAFVDELKKSRKETGNGK
jgi:peptidyl-dipeptidase A